MVDSPVPDQVEVIATLSLLFGAPFAAVMTVVVILGIADWIRFGHRAVRITVDAAHRTAHGVGWLQSRNWGQLTIVAAAQGVAVGMIYLAVRWTMFFPRSPWRGETTTWLDRVGYLLRTPHQTSPEVTAAFVAVGVAAVATMTIYRRGSITNSIAEGVGVIAGGLACAIAIIFGGAGLIGITFFSLSIGSSEGSIRTDDIKATQILEAEIARDSAFTLLILGVLYLGAWGAILAALKGAGTIRARAATARE